MLYSVKYKTPNQWFFRKLKNVKGDGIVENSQARFFILADETRIELPNSCTFIFDTKRFDLIKSTIDASAGQTIPINKTA